MLLSFIALLGIHSKCARILYPAGQLASFPCIRNNYS